MLKQCKCFKKKQKKNLRLGSLTWMSLIHLDNLITWIKKYNDIK
jgi:hypothetical protein